MKQQTDKTNDSKIKKVWAAGFDNLTSHEPMI